MQKLLLFSLLTIFTFHFGVSQSVDLLIFSEEGKNFHLFLNSIKKNDQPQAMVKVSDLDADAYKLKIRFQDQSLKEIKQAVWLEADKKHYAFVIKRQPDGSYHLEQAPAEMINNVDMSINTNVSQGNMGWENDDNTDQFAVNSSVNARQESATLSIDVNINDKRTSSDSSFEDSSDSDWNTTTSQALEENEEATANGHSNVSHGGCYPMEEDEFADAKSSIKSKTFEDSQVTVAKQILKNECVSVKQLIEILNIFEYEDTKLEFAKFAYEYVYNPNKYYKVSNVFEYESTIEELNEYLENK